MKRQTLIRWARAVVALVFLTSLVSLVPWMAGESQSARATPTRAATALPLVEGLLPSPEATARPMRTAILVPSPTFTPTPDRFEIAATLSSVYAHQAIITRCTQYLPLVHLWHEFHPDLDPALVLAVAAVESHCDPSAESSMAVGLMQIIPLDWTATRAELLQPSGSMQWGMWFLDMAMGYLPAPARLIENLNPGHDIRLGLAIYNCGPLGVAASEYGVATDMCGDQGGFVYADLVINVWWPRMRDHLDWLSLHGSEEWAVHWNWLRDLGYGGVSGE